MLKIGFTDWILANNERKLLLVIALMVILMNLLVFKFFYPFLNFLPDSYSYLEAAINNQEANIWPIGYSKFLRLISCFTTGHLALFMIQYLFLQGCALYLIFSVSYQFSTGKWLTRILIIITAFNPLVLLVSNFVSSDALFAAFSLLWLTQILWLIYRLNLRLILIHALTLLIVFTLRYNAIYYPLISISVLLIARVNLYARLIGIVAVLILIGGFITNTLTVYKSATGTAQFSAFGGWQLASNALFAYAHAKRENVENVPERFRRLHSMVERHMDSVENMPVRPDNVLGIYYLWDERAPLKSYMNYSFRNDTTTSVFKRWALMAPLYATYGRYIIAKHLPEFGYYYLLPNTINYYVPPTEFLASYNMGMDTIEPIAVRWFGLTSSKVSTRTRDKSIGIADFFPILLAIINVVFIVGLIGVFLFGNLKKKSYSIRWSFMLVFILWLFNLGFSVLASPIVLRYQVFPMIFSLVFASLFIELIANIDKVEVNLEIKEKKGLTIATTDI